MKITDILTKALAGKIVRGESVSRYNSVTCHTEHSSYENIKVEEVGIAEHDTIVVRGHVSGGKNDGQECYYYIDVNTEITFSE